MLDTFASAARQLLLYKAQSSKRKQKRPKAAKTQKPFCRFAFQFHFHFFIFLFCSTLLIAVAGRNSHSEEGLWKWPNIVEFTFVPTVPTVRRSDSPTGPGKGPSVPALRLFINIIYPL